MRRCRRVGHFCNTPRLDCWHSNLPYLCFSSTSMPYCSGSYSQITPHSTPIPSLLLVQLTFTWFARLQFQWHFLTAPIIYNRQDNPRYLEMASEKKRGVACKISTKRLTNKETTSRWKEVKRWRHHDYCKRILELNCSFKNRTRRCWPNTKYCRWLDCPLSDNVMRWLSLHWCHFCLNPMR